jgi:hypothetical protein
LGAVGCKLLPRPRPTLVVPGAAMLAANRQGAGLFAMCNAAVYSAGVPALARRGGHAKIMPCAAQTAC